MHRIVIEANELTQKSDRQQALSLGFFFDNDLRQHLMGDVFTRLGVAHDEIGPLLNHLTEILEGDITAGRRVVEPTVRVFLDDHRLAICAAG